jgi:predicted TIM-barrel fold metal-dependent hydrolase
MRGDPWFQRCIPASLPLHRAYQLVGRNLRQVLERLRGAGRTEEATLELTAHTVGADRILIGSDFPHPDAFYPNFVELLLHVVRNLSAADQEQILRGSARGFYKV